MAHTAFKERIANPETLVSDVQLTNVGYFGLTNKDINDPNSGIVSNAKSIRTFLIDNCRGGHLKLDGCVAALDRPYRSDLPLCEPLKP